VGLITSLSTVNHAEANAGGPIPGVTGSPFDGITCDAGGCHNSFALKPAQPGWITSTVPYTGFVPGVTYTITAKAVFIGRVKFGFEISPQSPSGTYLGQLINTSSKTQIKTQGGIGYIEQTASGNSGTDSVVWTFNWRAPIGVNTVTFYGAFNCANNNGTAAGDFIYTSTLTINLNPNGVNELAVDANPVSVYPNPATDECNVTYTLNQQGNVEVNLYSVDGKKIANLLPEAVQSAGEHRNIFNLAGLSPGIYLVQVIENGDGCVKKLVIQ